MPPEPPTPTAPPAPLQQAPSGNPYLSEPAPAPKKRKSKAPLIIGIVVAVLLVAGVVTAGLLTNWFGLAETGAADAGVPVRESVNDYSWEELGQISDAISAAESDEDALAIATDYNLCNDDGTLDGTQTKDIELSDGTKTAVQIVGFNHDKKADGSGTAGITFMFCDAIDYRGMNDDNTNEGGWSDSEARSYLNDDFVSTLPDELQNQLVEVEKDTNNEGLSFDADSSSYSDSCVDRTADRVWLPSYTEMVGKIDSIEGSKDGNGLASIYNDEGSQYQLFSDQEVTSSSKDASILERDAAKGLSNPDDASAGYWWLRTPNPGSTQYFLSFNPGGGSETHSASLGYGLVPMFAL